MKVIGLGLLAAAAVYSATNANGLMVVARIRQVEPHDFVMVLAAKAMASHILANAGVRLEWDKQTPGVETIEIVLDDEASPHFAPRTMAYARPFAAGSETRVHIFRDRVHGPGWLPKGTMLGYVLAHEIAHVLEGIDRHSDEGVMKARWDLEDYAAMLHNRLTFSEEDVRWIHVGTSKPVGAP